MLALLMLALVASVLVIALGIYLTPEDFRSALLRGSKALRRRHGKHHSSSR